MNYLQLQSSPETTNIETINLKQVTSEAEILHTQNQPQ